MMSKMREALNMSSSWRSSFSRMSWRLPLAQYAVTTRILGESKHAPMNGLMLSCRRSRIWRHGDRFYQRKKMCQNGSANNLADARFSPLSLLLGNVRDQTKITFQWVMLISNILPNYLFSVNKYNNRTITEQTAVRQYTNRYCVSQQIWENGNDRNTKWHDLTEFAR